MILILRWSSPSLSVTFSLAQPTFRLQMDTACVCDTWDTRRIELQGLCLCSPRTIVLIHMLLRFGICTSRACPPDAAVLNSLPHEQELCQKHRRCQRVNACTKLELNILWRQHNFSYCRR